MIRKVDKSMIDKICLEICDGHNGICQRYPIISESCEDYIKLKKAYLKGIEDATPERLH